MMNDFIDQYGNCYAIKQKLAEGGQGRVLFTERNDILIKLALENSNEITDYTKIQQYNEKINKIRLLPLPMNINIVKPLASLQNKAGYIMTFLDEMQPISSLKKIYKINTADVQNSKVKSELLQKFGEEGYQIYQSLIDVGGLRRKLILLSKLASILARIHANGLVYGDLSHNNIFISKDENFNEVWLIDIDNISFDSGNTQLVYTPEYAAPELKEHLSGITIKSDDFALAILIYQTLTITTPWIDVRQCPDKNIQSLWVDDPSNQDIPLFGIKRDQVIHKNLHYLFSICFNDGYRQKDFRPSSAMWAIELAKISDKTVKCQFCKSTWMIEQTNDCPCCDQKLDEYLRIDSFIYQPNAILHWQFCHELSESIQLPERLFRRFHMQSHFNSILNLKINKDNQFMLYQKNELYSNFDFQALIEARDRNFNRISKALSVYSFKDTVVYLSVKSPDNEKLLLICQIIKNTVEK